MRKETEDFINWCKEEHGVEIRIVEDKEDPDTVEKIFGPLFDNLEDEDEKNLDQEHQYAPLTKRTKRKMHKVYKRLLRVYHALLGIADQIADVPEHYDFEYVQDKLADAQLSIYYACRRLEDGACKFEEKINRRNQNESAN